MKDKINKTKLDLELALKRGFVHRDYLAHCLRWQYTVKTAKRGMKILDVGCGDGILAQILYSQKLKPALYIGIDLLKGNIEKLRIRKTNYPITAYLKDIRYWNFPWKSFFDLVTCFEVIEHFEAKYLDHVLQQIVNVLKPNGILLLSTPNYDGKHKASNHIHEYEEKELKTYLTKYFILDRQIGTFASQKEIYPTLNEHEKYVFDGLKPWLDSNILSIIFAGLHPLASRNILWKCRKID